MGYSLPNAIPLLQQHAEAFHHAPRLPSDVTPAIRFYSASQSTPETAYLSTPSSFLQALFACHPTRSVTRPDCY
jgi:hypothetical protein